MGSDRGSSTIAILVIILVFLGFATAFLASQKAAYQSGVSRAQSNLIKY